MLLSKNQCPYLAPFSILPAFALMLSASAVAQDKNGQWSGEGALGASLVSGNTRTSDIGLGIKLERSTGPWTAGVQANVDYGESDKTRTRNYFSIATRIDRAVSDRWSVFGEVSHEKNEFSGFDARTFAGAGPQYKVLDSDRFTWKVSGGVGWKTDQVKATIPVSGVGVRVPSRTSNSYSLTAGSNVRYRFSEHVTLSNDTGFVHANLSSQITNMLALDTTLAGALRTRASVEIRHDTNPPAGFRKTDTITRLSLVYNFGNR